MPVADRSRVAALDGLRGLAVAAVLLFHAGFGWASGGFLGVSVFFTLSGFLITDLLQREAERRGAIDLRRFYRRRAARLVPAGLLGLVLAVVVGHAVAVPSSSLHGDVLAALGQVANWRWLLDEQSYADLFATPSPVLHYWSLSIEEQYYLVFPPLVLWLTRRSGRALVQGLAWGLAASWLLLVGLVVVEATDAAYYATPARFGEILAGALLAVSTRSPAALGRVTQRARPLAVPALAVLLLGVASADASGRWSYLWLPVTGLATVVLLLDALGKGPVGRAFEVVPLVVLGRISYGVYVYHWPIYLYLSPDRIDLSRAPLTGLRIAATLVLATASFVLVEEPVRRRMATGRAPRRRPVLALGAPCAAVAVALVVLPAPEPPNDLEAIEAEIEQDRAVPTSLPLAVFGDSNAAVTGIAIARWREPDDPIRIAVAVAPLGCGLELPGERRSVDGPPQDAPAKCLDAADSWAAEMAGSGAEIALVQSGAWEVLDHRLPGEDEWRHLGDPVLDEAYRARFLRAVDTLMDAGARRVVWLTAPPFVRDAEDLDDATRADLVARSARYNEIVRDAAARRPEVTVLDYAAQVEALVAGRDAELRPDGVHLTDEATLRLVDRWLGPELLAMARDLSQETSTDLGRRQLVRPLSSR